MNRSAFILPSALLLASCGNIADLEPRAGQPLPVKPLMAQLTPDADKLLELPAAARPDRVDELMRRSAPRVGDRFDLPPPTGSAPTAPVEASADEDEDETNAKGPVKPL